MQPDDFACAAALTARDVHSAQCALPRSAWRWTAPAESIVSDLSPPLICERAWLNEFANSAYFFGFLLGAALWGTLSDRFGRRRSLITCLSMSGIVTSASAFVQGYPAVFASRIVQGVPSHAPLTALSAVRLLRCSQCVMWHRSGYTAPEVQRMTPY